MSGAFLLVKLVIIMRWSTEYSSPFGGDVARVDPPQFESVGGTAKRVLDVLLVLASLPFLIPVLMLLAGLVALASPGPIFYAHRRVGLAGTEFGCLKFRTMVTNGDQVLHAHLRQNPHERLSWEAERKLKNDPRGTRIGALLRKSSLDELPQLLNVLRGEMSLVGPRPVVRDELIKYGRSARYYLEARPGLTGLWQISWTLLRDLWIIAMTIPAVIASKGAR